MAKEIEKGRKGAKCLAIAADVRDAKVMEAAADSRTVQELGRIDFVIAGAAGNFLTIIDVSPFSSLIDVEFIFQCVSHGDGN
jgi:peroxisomal 2,4-dienoyl-CoA reductase